MELTEAGKKLYKEISTPIEQIVETDKKYMFSNEIRLGTYATMLSKVLSGVIAEFYTENKNAKITAITDISKVLNFSENYDEFDIAVLKKYDEDKYDSSKYKFISLGYIDYILIANNNCDLSKKKNIKIKDLKDKIIYIPRGDNSSISYLQKIIEDNNMNNEIKRIDSVTIAQIVQEFDNCIGEANSKYFEKEIQNKMITVLDTEFKLPSVEIGIYCKKNNNSKEIKNLIKLIKEKFNYNK